VTHIFIQLTGLEPACILMLRASNVEAIMVTDRETTKGKRTVTMKCTTIRMISGAEYVVAEDANAIGATMHGK
jgi:hypothetical protein